MTGESYTTLVSAGPVNTSDLGINVQSSATTITLTDPAARVQRISMTAASQELRLPTASNYSNGQDFIIANAGANSFTIATNDGTDIVVATAGNTYYVYLVSNATAQGTWATAVLGGGGASTGANADITSLTGLTTPLSPGQGGTGTNMSATGGANQFVKQSSSGGNFSAATILAADLPAMVGDSGAGGTKGAVPAPSAGDTAAGKFLRADGTFAVPGGSGAASSETYVTIGNTSGLSAERALTAGSGITVTDGGAGSTVTIAVTVPVPATSGNGASMVRANSAATALEYRTAAQVRADLDLEPGTDILAVTGNGSRLTGLVTENMIRSMFMI